MAGTRRYTPEEKAAALAYLDTSQLPLAQVARELEVNEHTLRLWNNSRDSILGYAQAVAAAGKPLPTDEQIEAVEDDGSYAGKTRLNSAKSMRDLAAVVRESEERKQRIIGKAEAVIEQMIGQLMSKVEDANLDSLVDAIDKLLSRIESMTASSLKGADRSDYLVDRMVGEATGLGGDRARVEQAVLEAFRRRGLIGDDSVGSRIQG